MRQLRITIRGIVQGVGFRPFVYRLAHRIGVAGWVANTGSGVEIAAQGSSEQLNAFLKDLENPPPLAVIEDLSVNPVYYGDWSQSGFVIRQSEESGSDPGPLPPDADLCQACLRELLDPADRRFLYPFINCTDCGPRYTVIENIPYDRPATSMKRFPLCPLCQVEYLDPKDRRFHAQTNCCPACGPHYRLFDNRGVLMDDAGMDSDAIERAALFLQAGKIVALKGIGGFHLAVDATNNPSVALLRERKRRPDKPLAIMVADVTVAEDFAWLTSVEREALTSSRKPVVLLFKRQRSGLAEMIAPDSVFVGIMLPYAPLHYLLFKNNHFPALVMTSGNLAGSPIIRENDVAIKKLGSVADYFLVHDRDILISNDDSVVRVRGESVAPVRRSRSYAPSGISLQADAGRTLAFGAMLKNTICLTRGKSAFFSHHIGDLENPETVHHLQGSVEHFLKCLRITPELVVHDLHPNYPSTLLARQFATERNLPVVGVQHHHAHAVSCMAEHGLAGPVLAVVLDGSGWGIDSTVWGGELLVAGLSDFERVGHLLPVPMPGGDAAVLQPWRMALAYLRESFGNSAEATDAFEEVFQKRYATQLPLLLQMLEKGVNCPLTSSCGRLFDGLSALLGLCERASFEGQAAARIEMIADVHEQGIYKAANEAETSSLFATGSLFREIMDDLRADIQPGIIAARFQNSLATFFAGCCKRIGRERGIEKAVLSGGVFQNMLFRDILKTRLDSFGFRVYTQDKVPPGDGGIALGQAVAGRAMYQRSRREERI